jgi:hypothetical protein
MDLPPRCNKTLYVGGMNTLINIRVVSSAILCNDFALCSKQVADYLFRGSFFNADWPLGGFDGDWLRGIHPKYTFSRLCSHQYAPSLLNRGGDHSSKYTLFRE